jgi:hypothetical protein
VTSARARPPAASRALKRAAQLGVGASSDGAAGVGGMLEHDASFREASFSDTFAHTAHQRFRASVALQSLVAGCEQLLAVVFALRQSYVAQDNEVVLENAERQAAALQQRAGELERELAALTRELRAALVRREERFWGAALVED